MSMQICVLSDTQLNSISEWQRAIDAQGFPLRLSNDELLAQVRDLACLLGRETNRF